MAFRLRPRARAGRPTQQAVSDPPQEAAAVQPAPVVYTGTTFEPEEGDAERISSAADVDPNFKRYGVLGRPGGAGGFGGAGTK